MPSPFHQKYSSQSHKIFGDNTVPAMPEGPKQEADRRASDSSMNSASSPTEQRRRSSAAQRFGNLENLKRPQNEDHANRRQSLQDSYGKVGFLGSMWNNFTRGPSAQPQAQQPKEPRDTTTLRG